MAGFEAFRTGIRLLLRYPQVWAAAFLFSLLPALILALLPALTLLGPAHYTAIQEAADGIDAWLLMELLTSPAILGMQTDGAAQTLPQDTQGALLVGLITLFLAPFVAWLPGAFFYGGALLTYAEAPEPFRWKRFAWGGWHWMGGFAALAVFQGVAWLLLFLPVFLTGLGTIAGGGWSLGIALGAIVLVGTMLLASGEAARAAAVVRNTRNPIQALAMGVQSVFARPRSLLGLYLPALLLLLALHALFRLGLLPILPLSAWPLVLLAQQAFILSRLGARLVRFGGNVALLHSRPTSNRSP